MTFAGGVVWWMLLGALGGWLAAWWLGRSSQRLLTEPVVQILERRVDNPLHVSRILMLEGEAAELKETKLRVATLELEAARAQSLQSRVDELLAAPPRTVEKVVTRTVDRVIEKPVDRIVEVPVERVVEKVVERVVPDVAAIEAREAALRESRHRVEHLQALAAVWAGRVQASASTPPTASTSAAPSVDDDDADVDSERRALRARVEHLEALTDVQSERLAESAARAAAASTLPAMAVASPQSSLPLEPDLRSGDDAPLTAHGASAMPAATADGDIEVVEGIGPRIAELLRARGLGTFGALASASPGTLREILEVGGSAYRVADPSSWPEQARLAADGRWDELKALQDVLTAGRR